MKKIIHLYIAGALSLALFSGCKKNILDTIPQTSISDKTAFNTPEKILAQANNLYKKLQNEHYWGGRLILINEQRGEEFTQNDPNPTTGAGVWGQNVLASNEVVNIIWSMAYGSINDANIFISNVENTSVIGSPLREQYIGEAKFVRALNYFSLVQIYAQPYAKTGGNNLGLPLRLSAEVSAGNNDLGRSSVAQVYDQIIKDLDEAEATLPESYSSNALTSSRAHKATAIALKTRVYLVKGDYKKVIQEAKKIVPAAAPYQYVSGSLTHRLESSISTVFTSDYTGPESLFSLPFNNIDAPSYFSLASFYLGLVNNSLHPDGIITDPVFSSPGSTDDRKNLVTVKNNQDVLKKFTIITAPYLDYVKVIRYAEVLLNYAEAAAEDGDLETAVALLEAIRNRADASYAFASEAVDTKSALVQTILTERRIELLGEGFRASDLQRRLQTLPGKSGSAGIAPAVDPAANNYIWPIPSDETSTNKIIELN